MKLPFAKFSTRDASERHACRKVGYPKDIRVIDRIVRVDIVTG